MGRKLMRVPLDFNWPLGVTWGGYLNPYSRQSTSCEGCRGSGYSPEASRFHDEWYGLVPFDPVVYGAAPIKPDHPAILSVAERNVGNSKGMVFNGEVQRLYELFSTQWSHHLIQADVDALLAAGRLKEFTHVPRTAEQVKIVQEKVKAGGNSWLFTSNGYVPSAEEVNDWSLWGIGHDSINSGVCVSARCHREGVIETCIRCGGKGSIWPTEEIKRLHDEWEPVEPPTGEGFQLWETTSEGSPGSPVFTTLDELCKWCAEYATTFASFKATAEEWHQMLSEDFVHAAAGNHIFM